MVKNPPAVQETWVQSLGWEDPLEKGTATHPSILAWRIPWTERPGRLQSIGSQRVGHNWATFTSLTPPCTQVHKTKFPFYNHSALPHSDSLGVEVMRTALSFPTGKSDKQLGEWYYTPIGGTFIFLSHRRQTSNVINSLRTWNREQWEWEERKFLSEKNNAKELLEVQSS